RARLALDRAEDGRVAGADLDAEGDVRAVDGQVANDPGGDDVAREPGVTDPRENPDDRVAVNRHGPARASEPPRGPQLVAFVADGFRVLRQRETPVKDDILPHFLIVHPGEGREPFDPPPHRRLDADVAVEALRRLRDARRVIAVEHGDLLDG